MEIRKATDADIPEIIILWKEFMDFHSALDSHLARSDEGHIEFAKWIGKLIEQEDNQVLVALMDSKVIAYSLSRILEMPPVMKTRKIGYINDLAVNSEFRRTGVGEKMLKEILAWFKANDIRRIELRALAANDAAVSFWKKRGFEVYMLNMSRTII